MKIDYKEERDRYFRIWCECCSIRIAPHEQKMAVNGKTYHQKCYSKHGVSKSTKVLGDKK